MVGLLALVLLHQLMKTLNKLREFSLRELRWSTLLALLFALGLALMNFDTILILEKPSADDATPLEQLC